MSTEMINKTMDRDDLLTPDGQAFTHRLDRLHRTLDRRHLPVTSWYGDLPPQGPALWQSGLNVLRGKPLGRPREIVGEQNRGGAEYRPVPGITNDDRHPWFLYWEAFWVTRNGPPIGPGVRVLDAGGTASLFSCFLASTGAEVHSIDFNPELAKSGKRIARRMRWNLHSYAMNIGALQFEEGFFDHAFSICVFEHLPHQLRRRALAEIARCLKPGGMICLTFDYRGPGVALSGASFDRSPEHLLNTPELVHHNFDGVHGLEVVGNSPFLDNGKSYLRAPEPGCEGYTFGAMFLRRT